MPYYSGSAGSLDDVEAALKAACVAQGWTLSGGVLHKGVAHFSIVTNAQGIVIYAGNGIDGANAITDPSVGQARIVSGAGGQPITFPVSYEIHVHTAPDEVYLQVNYGVEFWQWMAFGRSDIAGLPGTGVWFSASSHPINSSGGCYLTPTDGGWGGNNLLGPAPFWEPAANYGAQFRNGDIHHNFDGLGWASSYVNSAAGVPCISAGLVPRYARQPSRVNAQSALLDAKVWVRRADSKVSLAADFAHSRLLRIDNYDPRQVITLGSDRWRVYPFYRKSALPADRDGGYNLTHTGTMGWAMRYDGP